MWNIVSNKCYLFMTPLHIDVMEELCQQDLLDYVQL